MFSISWALKMSYTYEVRAYTMDGKPHFFECIRQCAYYGCVNHPYNSNKSKFCTFHDPSSVKQSCRVHTSFNVLSDSRGCSKCFCRCYKSNVACCTSD